MLLELRDLAKIISVLRTPLSPDGRMFCSFNVAGTETNRWNSSKSIYDLGTNLQNITERLRRMFIPDPGYVFLSPDLAQAESRAVAYLSGDEAYIKACESSDLHTLVASMVWHELPWSGDPKRDREIADRKFYRDYSYRFM